MQNAGNITGRIASLELFKMCARVCANIVGTRARQAFPQGECLEVFIQDFIHGRNPWVQSEHEKGNS